MLSQYRMNDLISALRILCINRLDVLVTGVTGAGKSTTLNAIFGKECAKVGDGVDPETMAVGVYELNDKFYLWDSPGLGDGVQNDLIHGRKLVDLLHKTYGDGRNQWIDLVIVIVEGCTRDMGTTYKLLNDIIIPHFPSKKILVAINQADIAMSGRNWNKSLCRPDEKLVAFLEDFSLSIKRRIKEATGADILKPVYYSAKYGYNMNVFMDFIIDNVPKEKTQI